jgi:hypothetical protein
MKSSHPTLLLRTVLIVLLVCTSPIITSHAAPAPAPAPAPSTTTNSTGMKPAEQSLRNSGPALAFTGIAVAGIGLIAGVDIADFLHHGQFIAYATQLKGLDVNFTACSEGVVGSQSQAKCPTNQNEKVFTRWSYWFNLYGLSFDLLPYEKDEYGNADPFAADVRMSRLVGTLIGVVCVVLVLTGIQVVAFKMTETEEKDYDDALYAAYNPKKKDDDAEENGHRRRQTLREIGNVMPKRCFGKCSQNIPQVSMPCFPVRYWFNWPNVQLKIYLTFHFSICCGAMAAISSGSGAGPGLGYTVLFLICVPAPFITFYITRKHLEPEADSNSDEVEVKYRKDVETYKLVGGVAYRDVDYTTDTRGSAHYVKPWRKSMLVAKFSAPYYNLKFKRRHWTTARLILNFVEAGILTGVVPAGRASVDGFQASRPDFVTIAAVLFYIIDFFVVMTVRPHYRCGRTVMGMLQCFHNLLLCMASVLYVNDGVMNTQDLLKIETDGVELMLCIVASVGCVTWMLFIMIESFQVFSRVYTQVKSGKLWDTETDEHRRNNIKGSSSLGDSSFSALADRSGGSNGGGLPPMLAFLNSGSNPMNKDTDKKKDVPNKEKHVKPKEEKPKEDNKSVAMTPVKKVEPETTKPSTSTTTATTSDGDLPAGWAPVKDPTTGRTYYYNATTRETSWTKPGAAVALPAGWRTVKDPTSGRTYYYNANTKETSWAFPKA